MGLQDNKRNLWLLQRAPNGRVFLKEAFEKENDTHNGKFISHLQEKRSQ